MTEVGKDVEEVLQEFDHLVGHLVKIMKVCVGVHIAESRAHWLVHEEQVREFIPRAVRVFQVAPRPHSIGPNFHEGSIHGAAAWATVQPYYCSGSVCKVTVVE